MTIIRGVEAWLSRLQAHNPRYTYGYDVGRKYIATWRRASPDDARHVLNFVDVDTGMVRTAASWKKPGHFIAPLQELLDRFGDGGDRRQAAALARAIGLSRAPAPTSPTTVAFAIGALVGTGAAAVVLGKMFVESLARR
jgi:hypothetical protein